MEHIVSIENVSFTYTSAKQKITAVQGLDLRIFKGEIFGFIGPNGAGKTTTIKLLLGMLKPRKKGNIRIFGKSPRNSRARSALGYMPETANYSPYLTPRELLHYYGTLFGFPEKYICERTELLLDMLDLLDRADHLMHGFSKGMMQKVSFAQALINDPVLLILDEPAGGLDPVARSNMRNMLSQLREEGKTVFFSSHELSEVELISDRVAVLNNGKLVACGTCEELLKDKGSDQTLERYFLNMIGAS